MTQLLKARAGEITPEMKSAAKSEGVDPEYIRQGIVDGTIVITQNVNHRLEKSLAIGAGLSKKVNANLGTSSDHISLEYEFEKLDAAVKAGAHAVMDLSTGGDIDDIRRKIIERSPVPVGTVPIYQAAVERIQKTGKPLFTMSADDIFHAIEKHAESGVDFVTVHCGVTRESVARLERQGRRLGIVSRGGSFLAAWMKHHQEENPLFTQFDRLCEIAAAYDVTLSLGDGLRPGCLADATDRAQVQETILLGELTMRAREKGVQVIIEGPGHMSMDQIAANVILQKKLCNGAPFYVLGPLVTDIAPGYDHITAAIGGALAALAGADFLCYVTPAEHLRLPTPDDVREGVIASRIAAHAADLATHLPGSWEMDNEMADAREALDWQKQIDLSINPEKARKFRSEISLEDDRVCSMCGEFCAIKLFSETKCDIEEEG